MRLIILPQAFKNVLPALANEFITLLKETSISGYIAIPDLTKGGDLIRSQTYHDAFLPLLRSCSHLSGTGNDPYSRCTQTGNEVADK